MSSIVIFPFTANNTLQLSASSAALDLALSQSPGPEAQTDSWSNAGRHRLSLQHNFPPMTHVQANVQNGVSNVNTQKSPEPVSNSRQSNRHSMEASLAAYSQASSGSQVLSSDSARPSLATNHLSYSTNDVPTLKNSSALTNFTPSKTHSQQFHDHNASLGRIPSHAMSNRHSRELSAGSEAQREDQVGTYQPFNSALQANLFSQGAASTISSPVDSLSGTSSPFSHPPAFPNQPFYAGYGMQLVNMGINPMVANPMAFQNPMQLFQQQNNFLPYTNYAQQTRFHDGQARMMQQRRMQHGEGELTVEEAGQMKLTIHRASSLHERQARNFTWRNS